MASGDRLARWTMNNAETPGTNARATFQVRGQQWVAVFDDTTIEFVYFTSIIPQSYVFDTDFSADLTIME
jgi:hypothetical protein